MLQFDDSWRFTSPGSIPTGVYDGFYSLIKQISRGRQHILEKFKASFASAAGNSYNRSSDAGWADWDLLSHMQDAMKNAPLFIEAFYDTLEQIRDQPEVTVPGTDIINNILSKHHAGYSIELPYLYTTDQWAPIVLPEVPPSFEQQARDTINRSLQTAETLLSEKRERPAVQELLWLLETITTIFEGTSADGLTTIEGKYFSTIIPALRKAYKGTSIEQILGWVRTLHGYLSSPGGGRMRHGSDLKDGIIIHSPEAQLYYDLTLSYIKYLLAEYDRLTRNA